MTDGTSNDRHNTSDASRGQVEGIPDRGYNWVRDPSRKEGCFIASVVYGNEYAYEVNVLREYRDNVLMQDELGKKFVEWYYNGGGEKMAEFIRGKEKLLIPIIRKGLDFVVEDYKIRKRI